MENSAVEIFFSFIDEDRDFYLQIRAHLSQMERQKRIHLSSSDDVLAGDERAKRTALLERAKIIALLVSPAYLQSDAHYREIELAMKQEQENKAHVVPILLKPCDYEGASFARLQILPRNGKPITQWSEERDQTFQEITTELKNLLPELPLQTPPEDQASIWTVPYPRNALFTGREAELEAIETTLKRGKNAAIGQTQAISGLGRIGKTQMALEYAYRHRQDYQYVFWVLADTRETLNADYSKIAELLDLPGKNQAEVHYIIEAVKSWLANNQGWLLILDNADDLSIIPDFLPPPTAPGHILLTTRSQALGRLAERIEAQRLDTEEGVAFLLYRSGFLNKHTVPASIDPKESEAAQQIVHELGGLPLALDQAGAYIEETSCPWPEVEVWEVCRQLLPHAQECLTLIERWQIETREGADLLNSVGVYLMERAEYREAQTYLAKSLLIDQKMFGKGHLRTTAPLDNLALTYLEQGKYEQAASLHEQALVINRKVLGEEHPGTAKSLNNLAEVYLRQGKYDESERLHQRALAILQKALGNGHDLIATSLNNRGELYLAQRRYEEARDLFQQALALQRKVWDETHPDTARTLHNLGRLSQAQGAYEEARGFFEQALATRRARLGEEHPKTRETLATYEEVVEAMREKA